jgi:enhancing lycopene biosynthesis protein 2
LIAGTAATAQKAGNDVVECEVDGVVIDEKNKIVTTPAYMYDATPAQVFAGISKCVTEALKL